MKFFITDGFIIELDESTKIDLKSNLPIWGDLKYEAKDIQVYGALRPKAYYFSQIKDNKTFETSKASGLKLDLQVCDTFEPTSIYDLVLGHKSEVLVQQVNEYKKIVDHSIASIPKMITKKITFERPHRRRVFPPENDQDDFDSKPFGH